MYRFSFRRVKHAAFLLSLGVLLALAHPAGAQGVQIELVQDAGSVRTYDVVAAWPRTVQATLDSLGAEAATPAVLRALAAGQATASELIELPALRMPAVQVVDAAYDEVTLPPGAADSTLLDFAGPVAEALALGRARKRPVVSLAARLMTYEPATGTLRRYTRLTVQVALPPSAAAKDRLTVAANPHLMVTRSVLADARTDGTTNRVFKVPIREAGLYRIDRSFLADLGLDPDAIEPNNLKVYGNGGAPLPALNSAPRYADLIENAVFVRGGGDGRFDDGDVLLFYAHGPQGWTYDAADGWTHYTHPFANDNMYFLTVGTTAGQRVGRPAFAAEAGATVRSQVTGRHVVEMDTTVWSKEHGSGHTWVSDQIREGGALDILSDATLPGLAAGTVTYEARTAIQSNPRATVEFVSGTSTLAEALAPRSVFNDIADPTAYPTTARFTQQVSAGQPLDLRMILPAQLGEPQAAIDWVRVLYPQELRAEGGLVRFATPAGETGLFEFVLRGFSGAPQVWDVTAPDGIRGLGVQAAGADYRVQVRVTDATRPVELVAFEEPAARSLAADQARPVAAQDLHGLAGYPDFIIVAPNDPGFLDAARDLADYRRTRDGLDVQVVTTEQLYNEFSGGVPDMRAVRDYLKFLYDRADTEARLPRYVLLFGDGHYNFRGLGPKKPSLTNWVFPYATEASYDPDASYTSDDYFALLDDDEGEWVYRGYNLTSDERVDLGIGRFPVQSGAEAQMLVDKVKRYESAASFGPWRAQYIFVADDGPTGLSGTQDDQDLHVQNVDAVASIVEASLAPELDAKKIYGISYPRVLLNGFRLPEAKREIIESINSGALIFNYSGHGGPNGLAQEELFTIDDARTLTNGDRLPLFITATCSFGWWDLDDAQSGAEALLLNPDGGAIGALTTMRLVYTSGNTNSLNAGLNREMNVALFDREADGRLPRLGDALWAAKNTTVGLQGNSRKFGLLGDPSMRLGMPRAEAKLEVINGTAVAEAESIPLRALDRVTLAGAVRDASGQVDASFDGDVFITVYDAQRRVAIAPDVWRYMPNPYYTVREDLIWRGTVRATAGRYQATFVVPKDISYSNEPGRITVYAAGSDQQALGFSQRVLVGGTSANPPQDAAGPEISLFLNDTTFVSGGLTTREPELIVKLFDESGINTVGAGVGHEMLLVVNGDEANAIDLSSRFRSEENSYQRGTVTFTLPEQEPGRHVLSVRAWDVLNNSGAAELDYTVTADEDLALRNVYNYPNPMHERTRFVFEHNQPVGTPADVQIRVYSLNGRPVRTLEPDETLPGGVLASSVVQVEWDGRDQDFDRLATGIYLYKVRVVVEAEDGTRQVVERVEKLAVVQ